MVDFTLATYSRLIESILACGYKVITVSDYLAENQRGGTRTDPHLILRHDAEWNPRRALAMARIEATRGIKATYYFRADTRVYDLPVMRDIRDMGHEIGYHFNTLDRCGGDFAKAIALFQEDLVRFRRDGFPVTTVCSHGDPRVPKEGYKVNNEILLHDSGIKERTEILGEAYLDVAFDTLRYVSDVGIKWSVVASTRELIEWFQLERPPLVYLLTHPDYWSSFPGRAVAMRYLARVMRRTKANSFVVQVKKVLRGVGWFGRRT